MSEKRLKVDEVAALLGETRHVVRNWLRDFRQWIPVERAANGYNEFPPDAVEKMKMIRHLYRDRGFSTRQIEHYFSNGEQLPTADIPKADDIAELKEMVAQLSAAQEQHNELARAILARMEDRDRQLTQYLTERREEMKRLKDQEARPWWKVWKN